MDLNLKGKTAVLAASSQGLGFAIAKQLYKEGANVVLSGRDEEKLKQRLTELEGVGEGKAICIETDLTNPRDIKGLISGAVQQFGTIDILVNNSGGPPAGSFESLSEEQWKGAFELNVLSYVRLIQEALPHLKKNGGRILNIASSSIKEPIAGLILSNTYRAGIVGMSKTLASELAPYKILINTIAPGRISTDRTKHLDQFRAEKLGVDREAVEDNVKKSIPLGRYGTPEEFAKVAAFLLSDANSYMTGQAFIVDGGMVKSI
ncbi:3-oxoacyl-ACP reductase [Bacillus sp. FJAT-27225]|uniref:SDR family oxidoreductase n=1 Tax=Bacillus sp. FJAT-27225 TaxID=1743144 RepID=UPI00080C206E|nr:SDR family oxidoreductase [Bacillus sp. FJAT-27225]OCA85618.1 3-oxoacyl-ACP reductase [Bacillus sp. FJAT-27225]